ncbi:ATP-binding protein [Mumia sp. Pv 4-285]|uniref:ATP-binding protein n=1 Tax=Mumia qirimensis TaxID=3234852 RepID=UPI00351D7D8E
MELEQYRDDRMPWRRHSGRMPFRMRLPVHRATTANLQAIYPFVIETGLGSEGVYIGRETGSQASFVYDPWRLYQQQLLTNTNVLLAGVIGRGKSALAKTLAYRLSAFGVRTYVPGDPKGEWGLLAGTLGVEPLALGRGLATRLNPLETGSRPQGTPESVWLDDVRGRRISLLQALAETGLGHRLTPVERNAIYLALDRVVRSDADASRQRTPLLPEVVEAMMRPSQDDANSLGLRSGAELAALSRDACLELRRLIVGDLAGLFDGATTHQLDIHAPIQVVDTSRLAGDDTALALLMSCASAWMEASISDATAGRRLVVYDEAWRVLRVPALVRRMQSRWKLSRALGESNLAVVHRISDLGAVGDAGSEAVAIARGLLADCSTRIMYAQESDQLESAASALGLTDVETSLLPGLPRGRGLWKVGRRSFIVDHVLADHELEITDTDARMR